jgi:hypothetical protein
MLHWISRSGSSLEVHQAAMPAVTMVLIAAFLLPLSGCHFFDVARCSVDADCPDGQRCNVICVADDGEGEGEEGASEAEGAGEGEGEAGEGEGEAGEGEGEAGEGEGEGEGEAGEGEGEAGEGEGTPLPTVTLTADDASVLMGRTTTLRFSSTNATACTLTPSDLVDTAGTRVVVARETTTYTFACQGPGGTAVATTTVVVPACANACTFTDAATQVCNEALAIDASGAFTVPIGNGSGLFLEATVCDPTGFTVHLSDSPTSNVRR